MTAFWGSVWALLDGTGMLGGFGGDHGAWLLDETLRSQYAMPGVFLSGLGDDEVLRTVAIAAVWTGVVTTAINKLEKRLVSVKFPRVKLLFFWRRLNRYGQLSLQVFSSERSWSTVYFWWGSHRCCMPHNICETANNTESVW